MKKWILTLLIAQTCALLGFSQGIGPCVSSINKGLKPVFIYDGIPFKGDKDFNKHINPNHINSMGVVKDTIADYKGEIKYYGIIEVYSKDSMHTGLKEILNQTDNWLYKNPLASLELNGEMVDWDEETVNRLFALKAEDIVSVEIVDPTKGRSYQGDGLLKLRLAE